MMKKIFIILGLFFCCFLSTAQKPNILWVTIEDTSPQFIGCYGNKDAKTPNLDKLAREGVRFARAFANAPVCSSARSTIITGILNGALGTGNHRSKYPISDKIKGFPTYLRENGWYTSNNVKTDYNTSDSKRLINESWNESSKNAGWWKREKDKPFFSVFNYIESHQSRTMTFPYKWYLEEVYNKLEDSERIGENDFDMPPYFKDTPQMRKYFARVYNSISLTDKAIGKLLARLKDDGLMDETIIFFYADHGEAIPRGKSGSVGIGYKVPMIIWFPEKYKKMSPWKIGSISDELICFDDLAPTVLSIAGIEPPAYITGRAFLGEFRENPNQYVFTSRNRIDESPGLVRSITDGRYMYSKVFKSQYPELEYQKYADVSEITQQIRTDFKNKNLNEVQADMLNPRETSEYLYELEKDRWKLKNLAGDSDKKEIVLEMKQKLYDHILQLKDIMFLPEYAIDSISKHSTPYEYRLTEDYHLKEILKQAFLSGEKDKVEEILNGLDSDNKDVVYWSLIGIQSLKNIDLSGIKKKLIDKMTNQYPPIKVAASSIAFEKLGNRNEAVKAIKKLLKDDNPLVALDMLQNIQYMKNGTEYFKAELKSLLEKRKGNDDFSWVTSSAETSLHNIGEGELYYEHMKKWWD